MRPVLLAFRVLEEIAAHQPIGVTELARALGLPKTTIHRSLQVLQKTGWIAAEQGRPLWSLTIRPLCIGSLAINSQGPLRAVSIPAMESLRRASGETVHLNVYYQSGTVLLERLDGLNPTTIFSAPGGTVTLHPTAAGRMKLALMNDAELDRYFAEVPSEYALEPEDEKALRDMLTRFREDGFSITEGGLFAGITAVAAPVLARDGVAIAALSISAPSARMAREKQQDCAAMLINAARDVSAGMRLQT